MTVEDDPSYFTPLARWERVEEEPSVPAQPEPATHTQNPDPIAPPPIPMPAPGADREVWVAYALAHGKTAADIKNVKTTVIAKWFATPTENESGR
ncbi:hypothetical protein ACIBCN_18795 [Nocardia sp. NPDC051052]|uniref:hypothetical protein n=1 Tax=Nocardia sp. NPDC051052 TaxID=3364322 RepID=UPI0037A5DE1A